MGIAALNPSYPTFVKIEYTRHGEEQYIFVPAVFTFLASVRMDSTISSLCLCASVPLWYGF